jgi:hypothetical protein
VQLRKVEHPRGKSFYWACNGPDCPYESEDIKYTMDNYDATPPFVCPRCRRSGNLQVDMMSEGIPAVPQPASTPDGLPEKVGNGNHPEEDFHVG